MAAKIVGKYKMESSEGFDEFMKALGVGLVMRKMASTATPSLEISENEGTYTMKTVTTFKTTEISFKLGEPFTETTADGRVVQSTITLDGNTMTHKQVGDKEKNEKDSILTRVFNDTGIDMECKVDDVVCKRIYKRQEE
ncbi:sodium/calcium exchanger regulatory protein 1 [Hyalella azteca]|uniref:Sodium/calcium exchanger regulatory protein 1 n=1 Tax=Hyalella azteca TaxID=294128 RepID=A0A8B7NTY8_HYAAZ|nr:sodium/calcium exchanger regulatory protein 1 [Hyalella azteca]